jgi:folate-binding protein YgfZ
MSNVQLKTRPSALLPAAGWTPLEGRAQLRLTGRDRASFLHSFCTNDIKKLVTGQGCEAFLTSIKGRILGHLFVFATADALLVDSVAGSAAAIAAHLDRYIITEDVQIADETAAVYVAAVYGTEVSRSLGIGDLPKPGDHREIVIGSAALQVRRVPFTSGECFEVFVAAHQRESLVQEFQQRGLLEVSLADFEGYRIDAGMPTYGVDLTEENLAQEASRTKSAISFTKGCYLGQEPIARLDAMGHVNRELRIVAFEGGEPVTAGMAIHDPAGALLGKLTSAGRAGESAFVGLALLRSSAAPDSLVMAVTDGGSIPGHVCAIED